MVVMVERPYVVASVAMSVDGFIDDASPERLLLSNDADFARVDELRASCDAILVGAETVRRDNPRLVVRSQERRRQRVAAGKPADPVKVTLTTTGRLDPHADFFTVGDGEKLVYARRTAIPVASERLGDRASVLDAGPACELGVVLADLRRRGVRRLLVEGGTRVHTAFLAADAVDELQVAIAPFFVGAPTAPRFVHPGSFPYGPARPMRLAEVRRLDDVVLLRYFLAADEYWLCEAIEESRRCTPSMKAYSVGAILVDAHGNELSRGHSRETSPVDHAEEVALSRVPEDAGLADSTLYTSLEPCSARASKPCPCADLIVEAGVGRVVVAWREPDLFVDCRGVERLRDAGVEVVEVPALASQAKSVNAHLFRRP